MSSDLFSESRGKLMKCKFETRSKQNIQPNPGNNKHVGVCAGLCASRWLASTSKFGSLLFVSNPYTNYILKTIVSKCAIYASNTY